MSSERRSEGRAHRTLRLGFNRCFVGLALTAIAALPAAAAQKRRGPDTTSAAPRLVTQLVNLGSGAIPTRDGLQLTLTADTGNVRIFTDASGEVRYQVRAEIPQRDPAAAVLQKNFSLKARGTLRGVVVDGRMLAAGGFEGARMSYEVHVPRRYNMEIATQAGDIVTQDVDGRLTLTTGGGNIQAGRAGDAGTSGEGVAVARLETGGGHILIGDVSGGLRASTGGGHVTAGNVSGDAVVRTEGGHIQIGRVGGTAQLTTGGGNITAASASDGVVAETAGGRIEFGEVAGSMRMRTGGGGVRIGRVAGATELTAVDGGLFLSGVEAPLRASSAGGGITAWFSPQFTGATSGPGVQLGSELASSQGDIVVYLPREMAVTIDAFVEHGANHRIVADPSLPLQMRRQDSVSSQNLRAQAALNGGGEILRLRANTGDIQLRLLDAEARRRLAAQQMAVIEQGQAARKAFLLEMGSEARSGSAPAQASESNVGAGPSSLAVDGRLGFTRFFEGFWWGGVRVDPDEQQKRLVRAVRPTYPEAARQAGLEGNVTLRLVIGADGAVKDARALSGEPDLARAALEAVTQWRYARALLDGRPVDVVTTVTLAFRLR